MDLWSLGAVLGEMLSKEPIFKVANKAAQSRLKCDKARYMINFDRNNMSTCAHFRGEIFVF